MPPLLPVSWQKSKLESWGGPGGLWAAWQASSGISLLVCPQVQLQYTQGLDHLRWLLEAGYGERWAESSNKRFLRISQTFKNDSGPALRNYFLEVSLPPEQGHGLASEPRRVQDMPQCPFGLWLQRCLQT